MARTEARIRSRIWTDPEFRSLSMTAQWAYTFLLSQSDLSYAGVAPLRVRRWAASANDMTVQALTAALSELEAARFVVVDHDAEELLVRTFLRNDEVYRQPNLLRAAHKALAEVTSPALRVEIAIEVQRCMDLADGAAKDLLAAMLDDLPNPTQEPIAEPFREPIAEPPRGRGSVTAVSSASPLPLPLNPHPPSPPAAPPPDARARAAKGTRLPDNFEPTPELIAWARQHAPTTSRADHDAFVDYWRAKPGASGRKLDWPATWRNWMRREHERRAGRTRASPNGQRSTTDERVAATLAIADHLDRTDRTGEPQ